VKMFVPDGNDITAADEWSRLCNKLHLHQKFFGN